MLKKKQTVEFTIEETEFGGTGYGYAEGTRIFVKNVIRGQKVRAVINKFRNNTAEGKILEVIEASPLEDQPVCSHFGLCGGCFQQTVHYSSQLKEKESQVHKLFAESGIQDYEWLPIEGSPKPFNYRNKMEFSFGDEEKGGCLTLGMHKRGRHYDIVTVDQCLIMDEDFRLILSTVLEHFKELNIPYYNSRKRIGYLRHLVIRKAHYTGQILLNLVTASQLKLDHFNLIKKIQELKLQGNLQGFMHTYNDNPADTVQSDETHLLFGQDYLTEKILGLEFKISAFSFFQTNTLGAEKLYTIVKDFAGAAEEQIIFDLFCGTGTIGQILSAKAKKVIGIDIVEDAVKAANENAQRNGLTNCTFISGDVREKVRELNEKPDIIVLDPPRAGIHPRALNDIIKFNAPTIVYVSCNPKTMVRDLITLENNGYKVKKIKCMDMFPHTAHVECVVGIQKVESTK